MAGGLVTLSSAEAPFGAKISHLSIDLLVRRFCHSSNKHSLNPPLCQTLDQGHRGENSKVRGPVKAHILVG